MVFPSKYSPEFRAEAVALVLDPTQPRAIAEVALELGMNRETLRYWVRHAQPGKAPETAAGRSGPRAPLNTARMSESGLGHDVGWHEGRAVAGPVPLIVVLDPTDDVSVTRRVLAAHAPERGVIVVHPTPGRSPAVLAHDLLTALGKSPELVAELGSAMAHASSAVRAKAAALAWLGDSQIRQIAVLRGHLFSSKQWTLLLEVHRRVGAAMIVIYHAPQVTGPAAAILERVDHLVVANLGDASGELTRFLARAPARTLPPVPTKPFPAVPRSEVEHFRADAARALDTGVLGHVDSAYRTALIAACGWVSTRDEAFAAAPLPGEHIRVEDGGDLALFLADLVADCADGNESLTRIRGAQAGFLLHGFCLRLPVTPGLSSGPGFSEPAFDEACAQQLRTALAHPVHAAALATAIVTGLDPAWLRRIRISDLAPDASFLAVRQPGGQTEYYGIAPAARSLLHAARTFLMVNRAEPTQLLLSAGIGPHERVVHDSAQLCGLPAPVASRREADTAWHHAAECWRAAEPIHGPGGAEPNRRVSGLYIRTLCKASVAPGVRASPAPGRSDPSLTLAQTARLMALVRRAMFAFEPARPVADVDSDKRELARRDAIVLRWQPAEDDLDMVAIVPHDDFLIALDLRVRGEAEGSEFAALWAKLDTARRFNGSHPWHAREMRRVRAQRARELSTRPMIRPEQE